MSAIRSNRDDERDEIFERCARHVIYAGSARIARHVNASNEAMRTQVSAVDDKYSDLPKRVAALEGERSES